MALADIHNSALILAALAAGGTALLLSIPLIRIRRRARRADNARLLLAGKCAAAEQEVARLIGERVTLRQTMAKLESSVAERDQLAALLDALPVPFWQRDGGGRIVRVNKAYAQAMGEPADAILSAQREFAPASIAQTARALGLAVANGGRDSAGDRRTLAIEGARHVFQVTEQRIDDKLSFGVALDDTDREAARAELARHIFAHEETLEQLGSAIAIYDAQQRMVFYNQAYLRLWQFDEAFLKSGPSFTDVLENQRERRKLPEERDFPRYRRERQALFTTLLEPQEVLQHLPDGSTYRVLAIPHPLGGLMFVTEDITDKLALETSYNTLIAVQRETLDNLAEGIIVFGADGRHRLHNPAWLRIWRQEESLLAPDPHISTVVEAMRPLLDDETDWTGRRERLISEAFSRESLADRMTRTDKSVIEYRSVPLPDGAVMFSCTDVTDSARVESALRTTNRALAEADRLKSEFVANVSYQLRTPLNTIMGFAEILTHQYFGPLNDRQMEYGRTILDASRRLLGLINAVLDLAQIEAGRMQLNRQLVDVPTLLQNAANLVQDMAKRQSLRLTVHCAAEINIVPLDDKKISQVLFNLLANALQYTPPGGRIDLSAETRGTMLAIRVSDTGIGIAESDQERVFDKFERSNSQTRQPGVGLGLALVRSFVELHGGQVELSSRMNEGTMVTCLLPLQPGEDSAATA